jgi:hypothetical protein
MVRYNSPQSRGFRPGDKLHLLVGKGSIFLPTFFLLFLLGKDIKQDKKTIKADFLKLNGTKEKSRPCTSHIRKPTVTPASILSTGLHQLLHMKRLITVILRLRRSCTSSFFFYSDTELSQGCYSEMWLHLDMDHNFVCLWRRHTIAIDLSLSALIYEINYWGLKQFLFTCSMF